MTCVQDLHLYKRCALCLSLFVWQDILTELFEKIILEALNFALKVRIFAHTSIMGKIWQKLFLNINVTYAISKDFSEEENKKATFYTTLIHLNNRKTRYDHFPKIQCVDFVLVSFYKVNELISTIWILFILTENSVRNHCVYLSLYNFLNSYVRIIYHPTKKRNEQMLSSCLRG